MANKRKDLGLKAAGVVFGLVAAAHLARVVLGGRIVMGSFSLPAWASGGAVIFAGGLSVWLFRLSGD